MVKMTNKKSDAPFVSMPCSHHALPNAAIPSAFPALFTTHKPIPLAIRIRAPNARAAPFPCTSRTCDRYGCSPLFRRRCSSTLSSCTASRTVHRPFCLCQRLPGGRRRTRLRVRLTPMRSFRNSITSIHQRTKRICNSICKNCNGSCKAGVKVK